MPSSPLLSLAIVVFIVGRFLLRELRERRLSNTQLFAFPGFVLLAWLVVAYEALVTSPGGIVDFSVRSAIAIPLGAVVGLGVARFTTVRLSSEGTVFFRGSYVTVAIWVVALFLRIGARLALPATRDTSLDAVASLLLLAFVASTLVRALVYRKARGQRVAATTRAEPAL